MPDPAKPGSGSSRVMQVAIVAIFLAAIAAPGLGLLANPNAAPVSETEMRDLAPWPSWSWQPSALAAWPAAFQRYFVDHFAFRDHLIHWRAVAYWKGFRASASDAVIAGKNDWLFYADDGGLQDYIQVEPFARSDLEAWRQTLQRTHDWLGSRGIRYLVVFAPDKPMVYPEYMPTSLRRMSPDYRVDRLLTYLRQDSNLEVLDLRPALDAAKSTALLYDPYDTHWNDRGGLVAYETIANRLSRWFPSIVPVPPADFVKSARSSRLDPTEIRGDLARMMALATGGGVEIGGLVPREGRKARVIEPKLPNPYGEDGRIVTEIAGSTLPRAVVFRDSFTNRLIPYLSEHFSRAVYLWQNDFDAEEVAREHPDVVIQEYVARHLFTFLPSPELVPEPPKARNSRTANDTKNTKTGA